MLNGFKEFDACLFMVTRIPVAPSVVTVKQMVDELRREGMPTTERTVQRRLLKLERLFNLHRRHGAPAGWSWPREEAAQAQRSRFLRLFAVINVVKEGPAPFPLEATG